MSRYLTIRRDGPVEYLTIHRPDVRNAFNEDVIAELSAWARRAATDTALRASAERQEGLRAFLDRRRAAWHPEGVPRTPGHDG